MQVRALLVLMLVASGTVAQVPPEFVPPTPGPDGQDDAGSGRDAPDAPDPAFRVDPGRIYEGTVTGIHDDQDDYFAFEAPAGSVVEFLVLGLLGCFEIVDESDFSLASACAFTPAYSIDLEFTPDRSGTLYLHYYWITPDAYRFAFAINDEPPRLAPLDPARLGRLTALAPPADAPVVVAVVDTGINAYHHWFAAPGFAAHPSTYLEGFPAAAKPLDLTLDAPSHADARAVDADVWNSVKRSSYDPLRDRFDATLYTIPGTRIVGAVSFGDFIDASKTIQPPAYPPTPILDEYGHGTPSAALAAGAQLPGASGDVLLVVVEVPAGGFEAGLRWVARQPYIDIVSFSLGRSANLPTIADNAAAGVAELVASGKAVLMSAGNGVTNTATLPDRCSTYTSPYTGPPGVTRIGAAEAGQASRWHCTPVDGVAATNLRSANHDSLTDDVLHTGTSAATPQAAAHLANLLVRTRQAGMEVSPKEALTHLLAASQPPPAPTAAPGSTPGSLEHGYGLIDEDAAKRAWTTLQQGVSTPRPELDQWLATDQVIRRQIWQSDVGASIRSGVVSIQDDAGSRSDAGDVPSAALNIAEGTFSGRLEGMGIDDHDWYAFQVRPGQLIRIEVAGSWGTAQIFDPNLDIQADQGYGATGATTIAVRAHEGGTWYLHLTNFSLDIHQFTVELGRPEHP